MLFGRKDDFERHMEDAIEQLDLGMFEMAERSARAAVQAAENAYGPVSEQLHDALFVLSDALSAFGDPERSEGPARRRLQVASQLWGRSDEQTAAAIFALGNVLAVKGDEAEAEALYAEALELIEATVGDGTEAALVLGAQAELYSLTGRFDRAEEAARRALSILDSIRNPPSDIYAEAALPLASVLRDADRTDEARVVLARAAEVLRADDEADPTDLAMVLNRLSEALADLERLDEAVGVMRQAVAVAQGTEAPATVMVELHRNLAELFEQMRDEASAKREWTRVLELLDDPDIASPQVADILISYGEAQQERGEFVDAQRAIRRAVALLEDDPEPDTETLALALNVLAGVSADLGDVAAAEEAYRASIAALERLGDDDDRLAYALANLGGLLTEEGRAAEAVPVLERSVAIAARVLEYEPAAQVTPLQRLGDALVAVSRHEEADHSFAEALVMAERAGDLYVPEVVEALRGRTVALLELGDEERALEFGLQAIDLAETLFATPDARIDSLAILVGPVLLGSFEAAEALALADRTLSTLPDDAPAWVRSDLLLLRGAALSDLDRAEESLSPLREALALAEPGSEESIVTRRALAGSLLDLKLHAEAESVLGVALEDAQVIGDEGLVAIVSAGFGALFSDTGRWAEAEAALRVSTEQHERESRPDDPELAYGLSRLAEALAGLGKAEEATEVARRARELATGLDPRDPGRIKLAERLGRLPG